MPEINVPTIIIERRTLLREGLVSLLHQTVFQVIASIASGDELLTLSPGLASLIIVGLARAAPDDLQLLQRIAHASRGYKIVAVVEPTGPFAQLDLAQALRSGADGCIFNVHSRDVLLKSLELALLGQKLVVLGDNFEPKGDMPEALHEFSSARKNHHCTNGDAAIHPALSNRELKILTCLASGNSNKLIARSCQITESTVKNYLKSILRKIHANNRTQAAIWAIRNNFAGWNGSPASRLKELPQSGISQDDLPDLFASENVSSSALDDPSIS